MPDTPSTPLTRYNGTIYAKSGDVIENLDIYSDGVGIELEDDDNVTIRNVRIHYNGANQGSAGIDAVDADNLRIQGVEMINAGAPATGPNRDGGEFGVSLFHSPGASVTGATVRDASTGIYLQDSPNAALEGIEGHNMRGPFPRGQLVQFNRSGNSSLNNFYVFNDLQKSWTEDNIHIGHDSDGVRITNGLIDGNNSPSGVGVMLEGAQNTTVRNVDTVHMGNGAFTDLGSNNLFDDVRSFDNFFASQAGRGTPLSGSLIFGLADDTTLINGAYQNPVHPENVVYGGGIQDDAFGGTYQAKEIFGQSPMAAWHNSFSWSSAAGTPVGGGTPQGSTGTTPPQTSPTPSPTQGTTGADTLKGTAGADTLAGGKGNDTYVVNHAGDKVIEIAGQGVDTVQSSVSFNLNGQDIERLTLTGGSAINGTGNGMANLITGNGAANILNGGAGADTLQGGLGNDTFVMSNALVTGVIDHITDFSSSARGNNDTVQLARSIFGSLPAGALAGSAFKDLGVRGARVDASDRILYNRNTGLLSYDADGSGRAFSAVPFAQLDNHPVITAGDFTVV